MLENIKRDVLAGRPTDRAWGLVRLVAYPALGDQERNCVGKMQHVSTHSALGTMVSSARIHRMMGLTMNPTLRPRQ
jgi:hypothetical protein